MACDCQVIEMAPAWTLPMQLREQLHADAVRLTSEAKWARVYVAVLPHPPS